MSAFARCLSSCRICHGAVPVSSCVVEGAWSCINTGQPGNPLPILLQRPTEERCPRAPRGTHRPPSCAPPAHLGARSQHRSCALAGQAGSTAEKKHHQTHLAFHPPSQSTAPYPTQGCASTAGRCRTPLGVPERCWHAGVSQDCPSLHRSASSLPESADRIGTGNSCTALC